VTPGLLGSHLCNPFALVASPKLGLGQKYSLMMWQKYSLTNLNITPCHDDIQIFLNKIEYFVMLTQVPLSRLMLNNIIMGFMQNG
jgi:hypothetical protein